MNEKFLEINKICENVKKEVIDCYSIIGSRLLPENERRFIIENPNAFILGLIADQSVKAEMAWSLPYRLANRLGTFDFKLIKEKENIDSIEKSIKEKPALHRYPRKMAEYIYNAICKIVKDYESNFDNLLLNNDAEKIVNKLKEFKGISEKKAALGALLLYRDFNKSITNLEYINIAYDVHIRRIFLRMNLVEKDGLNEVISVAKKIKNDFPGDLTLPFWVTGREFCHPTNPDCKNCYFKEVCEKRY